MMRKRNSMIASEANQPVSAEAKRVRGKNPLAKRSKIGARTAPRTVSAEERHRMIAETAYFIAERRGFAAGDAFEDWLRAEAEVSRRLG